MRFCGVESLVLIKVHYGLLTARVYMVSAHSGFSELNNLRKIIIAFISNVIVACTTCASNDATDDDTAWGTNELKANGGTKYFNIKSID